MPFSHAVKAGLTATVLAACSCFPMTGARAGIENQDTGEQCWGQDCSHVNDAPASSSGNGGGYATLSNVETVDCNDGETEKIDQSVRWLQANMTAIDGQMGQNSLMDWPGNSRNKFEKKLDKDLKFHCISDKNKCQKQQGLLGIVYPVVAQKRINICTQNLRDFADALSIARQSVYASVVAHEIGHLVRVNGHRNDCVDSFHDARFSQALGMAVLSAHRGVNYDPGFWASASCGSAGANQPTGTEIIEIKNQQKPPLQ